jgi:hypothetical protein
VADSCKHDNEPSCSIKSGNLLTERLLVSQEGLCFMGLDI